MPLATPTPPALPTLQKWKANWVYYRHRESNSIECARGERGRGSSALSRSLGGTSRKVLLVLFVSFSASNSVLRLMRCYCFYPCYLRPTLPLSFSFALNVCVAFFMWTKTRRKLNKASEFAAIAQLLQLFHLFPAISSICVPSFFPPSCSSFSASPSRPPLTNLHVSFRWKITPFKNLLYVLPDFSFILFHVPHPYSFCSSSTSFLPFSFVHSLV